MGSYAVRMDVEAHDLQQDLQGYLVRVAAGETIRVTVDGVATATITPIDDRGNLDRGVAQGWIRPATRHLQPTRKYPPSRRISDVLAEDREWPLV